VTLVVHLIRHAAHGLLGRVLAGRRPGVHLSPEGRDQAERLAARLAREPLAIVQTSPLERARETAEPIAARLGLVPEVQPALNEIDFGAWTGQGFDGLGDDPAWRRWNAARGLARPPGGETMLAVQARMRDHIEGLRLAHPDGHVALVSHCDVIRATLLLYLGLSVDAYDRIAVDPASVSTVAVGDWGARVLSLNEACP
jgi:probable phosphoglycerate mutase